MLRYVLRRIVTLIPVLLGVSLLIFTLVYMTPGDPARIIMGPEATEADVMAYRDELGLNDSFAVRYVRYVKDALHGDLGISYVTRQPVVNEILERYPTTLVFAIVCSIFAMIIAIPLGVMSAVKQYTIFDRLATVTALIGTSIPGFWLGLMLIIAFSVELGWLPSSGFYSPIYWILPGITIAANTSALIARMTRSSMLEVVRQDYIRTARAKGQKEGVIVVKHALKNALIPVITVVGNQFGAAMGGAIVTEQIFSIPGLGRLMVEAIKNRNYPIVQGGVLFIAISFCVVNLIVDLLYVLIDPRIRSQFSIGGKGFFGLFASKGGASK